MISQQLHSIDKRIAQLRALRGELRELIAAADQLPEIKGATCRIIEHAQHCPLLPSASPAGKPSSLAVVCSCSG